MANRESNKKPVLLQILPSLYSGGVERGTVEIAVAAAKEGFTSIVASSGGTMVPMLEAEGVTHIKLPLASKNPLMMFYNSIRLSFIIRKRKVNILHARSRAPAWAARMAFKGKRCRFITTFHGVYGVKGPLKKSYNRVMTKGDKIIAISNFVADHIVENYGIDRSKIEVIHRGVDLIEFDPERITKEDKRKQELQWKPQKYLPIILLPGRITRWKGHDFLLKALAEIPHHDYTCVFLGDDKHHNQYKIELLEEIERLKLRGNVTMMPNTPNMPLAYAMADLVVSASTQPEAFGRVAVEAQAMGRMVIATNHGGSAETIVNGKTGFLVSPTDPKEMAAMIEKVLKMQEKDKLVIATNARKHVQKNFSSKQMSDRTLVLYNQLLEGEE
ncbi:MAG: glycosyltransferase [Proteobacteria bacterium]|nr:glycosyltransferase [Pseudomonadota bacterium]